jgi:hypothetical protein
MQLGSVPFFSVVFFTFRLLSRSSSSPRRSVSPEEAIRISLYLNDKYSLDGRDPNGFVGVMWACAGVHDMGWAER